MNIRLQVVLIPIIIVFAFILGYYCTGVTTNINNYNIDNKKCYNQSEVSVVTNTTTTKTPTLVNKELLNGYSDEMAFYDDLELLTYFCSYETMIQDTYTAQEVASIVLNRVISSEYPNTIYEVIAQLTDDIDSLYVELPDNYEETMQAVQTTIYNGTCTKSTSI